MFTSNALYPYASKRYVTYGKNGMVATSQTQAAQVGDEILKKGGNAIDAAIGMAAALCIVEPTRNGLGGDAFVLFWYQGKLYGLNASGPSSETISIEKMKANGYQSMPMVGAEPITIPGQIKGWVELSERFGKLSFEAVLAPAIKLAKEGFVVSQVVAEGFQKALSTYKKHLKSDIFSAFEDTFSLNQKPPQSGDIFYLPDHAKSLELIAKTKGKAFYEGVLADEMIKHVTKHGGFLTKQDFKAYQPTFVNPIKAAYKGYDIWELPPNNQGIIALEALKLYQPLSKDPLSVISIHKQIEAMKLAFKDGLKYISDEKAMPFSPHALLDEAYLAERRKLISNYAQDFNAGEPKASGTVYLASADSEGNMVSFIQSNYMGFGSGVVIPNTGIAMQNRGHTFSLNRNDFNALEPNKRTYHTIMPGFITKNDEALGPFGLMGGFMQPQGHMQLIVNMIDEKLNPQAALDKWRWQWMKEKTVMVEKQTPSSIIDGLVNLGHDVKINPNETAFGVGQIILRQPHNHVYVGGCDKRCDALVLGH